MGRVSEGLKGDRGERNCFDDDHFGWGIVWSLSAKRPILKTDSKGSFSAVRVNFTRVMAASPDMRSIARE
jgi:hypothetical protein